MSIRDSLIASANRLGIDPLDWANVIGYETIGTFNPQIRGGKSNKYVGLIQMGPAERKKYGANEQQSFEDNLHASERYMVDRGLKPGMNLLDIYSTINAGRPGKYNASDGHGTVRSHVQEMLGSHRQKAANLLGMDYHPPSGGLDRPVTESDTLRGKGESNTLVGGRPRAQILGEMPGRDGIPFGDSRLGQGFESGGESDNLDTADWATKGYTSVAAPIITPTGISTPNPLQGVGDDPSVKITAPASTPQSRPASALDQPATENNPTWRIADAQARAAPDAGETPANSIIQGSDSSDTLRGQEDTDLLEPEAAASDEHTDLLEPEVAASAPGEPRHSDLSAQDEMTQKSIESINQSIGGKDYVLDSQGNPMPRSPIAGLSSLANKATLGLSNRIAAGVASAFEGEDYNKNLNMLTEQDTLFRKEHPYSSIAGDIVGPLPATLAGMGLVGKGVGVAANALTRVAPEAEAAVTAAGNFLSGNVGRWGGTLGENLAKLSSMVTTGAVEGAEAGVLQSQIDPNRTLADQIAIGAAIGAPFGVAGSLIGKALTTPLAGSIAKGAQEIYTNARSVFRDKNALPFGGNMAMQQNVKDTSQRLLQGEASTRKLQAWTGEAMDSTHPGRNPIREATPDNLARNSSRISSFIDDAVAQSNFKLDDEGLGDLTQWANVYNISKHQGPAFNKLDQEADRILKAIMDNGGRIPGGVIQDITKRESVLGSIINGKDAVNAAHAEALQKIILDTVDRTSAASGGPVINIQGISGTPSELYQLGRKWWKNQKIIEDADKAGTSKFTGVLDPMAMVDAALKPKRGGLSPRSDDLMRNLVHTAPFMPKVSPTGSAHEEAGPVMRVISNALSLQGAAPAAAATAGLIYRLTGSLAGTALGGTVAGMAGKARDTFLRHRMGSPEFANQLIGEPAAVARAQAGTSARRHATIAGGIGGQDFIPGHNFIRNQLEE